MIPSLCITPVGPLVIVPDEEMMPKLLNGPLFVIVPLLLAMIPLLVTVPEVVMTPPLAMLIAPSFVMTPLLVIVPMFKTTFDATTNVSAGPITRVLISHAEVTLFHTPPIDGDWHDSRSDTVKVSAIAFWAEIPRTEIITASTGSTSAFFMYVITSLIVGNAIRSRLHLD
jgi:hypothetical protein